MMKLGSIFPFLVRLLMVLGVYSVNLSFLTPCFPIKCLVFVLKNVSAVLIEGSLCLSFTFFPLF